MNKSMFLMQKPSRNVCIGFAVCLSALCMFSCAAQKPPREGEKAPEFSLTDKDGNTRSLTDLRGKVIFLNFWSVSCPPCLEEMPSMESLHKALANTDFQMIAVSVDEKGWQAVKEFIKKTKVSFTVLFDKGGKVARRYGTFKFPETFLIDKKGIIVKKFIGARKWDVPLYQNTIRSIIQGKSSTVGH